MPVGNIHDDASGGDHDPADNDSADSADKFPETTGGNIRFTRWGSEELTDQTAGDRFQRAVFSAQPEFVGDRGEILRRDRHQKHCAEHDQSSAADE